MLQIDVSAVRFNSWYRWSLRPRPSQEFDVPVNFGILGLYVLGTGEDKPGAGLAPSGSDLPADIVYIGSSAHVDRRLERWHDAVARYKREFGDDRCSRLWISIWYSDWTNSWEGTGRGVVAQTRLLAYERALIHAYAVQNGRLPALNRE